MFDSDNIYVLIPVSAIAGSLIYGIVVEIRKYASRRHELEVKRDMVERGLSAEEIERVIAVKSRGDK